LYRGIELQYASVRDTNVKNDLHIQKKEKNIKTS